MFHTKSLLGLALAVCAVPASTAKADFRFNIGFGTTSNNGGAYYGNAYYGNGYNGNGYNGGYNQSFAPGHHHHDPNCRPGYNAQYYPRPAYVPPVYGIPVVPTTPSYYTPYPYWRR